MFHFTGQPAVKELQIWQLWPPLFLFKTLNSDQKVLIIVCKTSPMEKYMNRSSVIVINWTCSKLGTVPVPLVSSHLSLQMFFCVCLFVFKLVV